MDETPGDRGQFDMKMLSDQAQLAVGLVLAVHADEPVGEVRPQLDSMTPEGTAAATQALLVLTRLFHSRAAQRARGLRQTQTLSAPPPPGAVDALGGDERVSQMTADLLELLPAWLADDASTEALAARYARRWGQDGLYHLAIAVKGLLPTGPAVWPEVKWAAEQLTRLEQGEPLSRASD